MPAPKPKGPKRPQFLRDKTGRVFMNTARLRDSGRGFYEIPDPVDFPEVGTAQGVFVGEDGRVTSPSHPKAREIGNRQIPNPPTPEITPNAAPSPTAEAYTPPAADEAAADDDVDGEVEAPDGWG